MTEHELQTDHGTLVVKPLAADRIYVESGWVMNVPGVKGTDGGIRVPRAARLGVTGTVHLRDGVWVGSNGDYETLSFDRRDRTDAPVTPIMEKSARATVLDAVTNFAKEQVTELIAADNEHRQSELRGLDTRIEEAEDYLGELRTLRGRLERGETNSQYDLPSGRRITS